MSSLHSLAPSSSLQKIIWVIFVVIYGCIPIVFAHITDLFGVYLPFYPSYSYESVKVIFFLALTLCICLLFALQMMSGEKKMHIKPLFLLLPLSIFISVWLSSYPIDALIGSSERLQGGVFFLVLFLFAVILRYVMDSQRRDAIIRVILYTTLPIFLYSIIQYFRLDPLFDNYTLTVFLHPVFATFGNSAYLAGYALLLIPIVFAASFSLWYRWVILLMLLSILLFTQSLTAIIVSVWYGIYRWYCMLRSNQRWFYSIAGIILFVSLFVGIFLFPGKVWNFMTRFDLWQAGIVLSSDSPRHFLVGHWPDTLDLVLADHPVESLLPYIAEGWSIRSFHNIFLDIFFSFWVIWLVVVLCILVRSFRGIHTPWQREVMILFFLFFSLNIVSVSHWIILIFALVAGTHVTHKKTSNNTGV